MPKFSEKEKEIIKNSLINEGTKLFSIYGLKKVTVDDLANAANIAKGSFYAFYENKEHLFIEISSLVQYKIFYEIEQQMIAAYTERLQPKECVKMALLLTIEKFAANPILLQLNTDTFDYIKRKLPSEIYEQHIVDDSIVLKKLELLGVEFAYPSEIAIKTIHPIFAYAFDMQDNDDKKEVLNILLDGVVSQIVSN